MAAAYSELPGKCLLVLQSASCGQAEGSGSGGGEVEVVDSRQVGLGEEGYLPAGVAVLRAGGLARTYSSISLAGFTLLSAGSTSEAGTPQVPPGHTPPHITPPCRRLHGGRARGADLQQRRGHPGRHRHQLQQVGHPALPPAHRLEIQVSSMMMMIMMMIIMMMTVAMLSTLLASSLWSWCSASCPDCPPSSAWRPPSREVRILNIVNQNSFSKSVISAIHTLF